ncbi:hypothetical protein MAR_002995 [Mya arenaria]|uniref:Uncharacterized protein n=1 Tax=Mya arenaria TaxID=6604 RepID=A0ABY7G7X0_MYAAR|nr:hypothetical protein MAR_002995 [Mya arenaria]
MDMTSQIAFIRNGTPTPMTLCKNKVELRLGHLEFQNVRFILDTTVKVIRLYTVKPNDVGDHNSAKAKTMNGYDLTLQSVFQQDKRIVDQRIVDQRIVDQRFVDQHRDIEGKPANEYVAYGEEK